MKYDIAIIGGGPSGILASIFAKKRGKKVILLEKNKSLGRKILLTGNGRCNISNTNTANLKNVYKNYFGHNSKFTISIFSKFSFEDTKKFFQDLGVEFKEEDNGRLFPKSNEAQSVVDALTYEVERLKIKTKFQTAVTDIEYDKKKKIFIIKTKSGEKILSKNVILATGGKTYPIIGTTGDGYTWAIKFGHRVYKQFPSYSGVITKSPICQALQGVKMQVHVKAFEKKSQKIFIENTGTIMFAHFGLSAPVVLEISRTIKEKLLDSKEIELEVNLFPDYNEYELEKILISRFSKQPKKTLAGSFIGLLPKKVAPAFLKNQGIDPNIVVSNISKEQRKKIISALTRTRFNITDVKGFEIAHFTAGGVDTKEVDPHTLESKKQKGLYFTGEILDIDGRCGGYNLQWAWSTGAVAGLHA